MGGSSSAISGGGAAAGVGVVIHDVLILLVSRGTVGTSQQAVRTRRSINTNKIFLSLSMLMFVKYGSLLRKCVVLYLVKYSLDRQDYN